MKEVRLVGDEVREQSGLRVAGLSTAARSLDLTDKSIRGLLEGFGQGIGVR